MHPHPSTLKPDLQVVFLLPSLPTPAPAFTGIISDALRIQARAGSHTPQTLLLDVYHPGEDMMS